MKTAIRSTAILTSLALLASLTGCFLLSPTGLAVATGEVDTYTVNDERVTGWALDEDALNGETEVRIFDITGGGEVLLDTVIADVQRGDTADGFWYYLDAGLMDGVQHLLSVKVRDYDPASGGYNPDIEIGQVTVQVTRGTYTSDTPPAPPAYAPQTPDEDSTEVSAITGEFRVNESGGATYSIPLATTPGTGNIAPSLSLSYNGTASNGPVGLGWAIEGLAEITRCRETLHQSTTGDRPRPIRWSDSDRLCFEGQKLVAVSGEYWQVGTEYRKEVDDQSRVFQVNAPGNTHQYFQVRKKDGSIIMYGYSGDTTSTYRIARRNSEGVEDDDTVLHNVYRWLPRYSRDIVGNPIFYSFEDSPDGVYLLDARYAYGENFDYENYNARLIFDYEATRPDPHRRYLAGYQYEQNKRLEQIRSENAGVEVRRWQLQYAQDETALSRLLSISECANNPLYPDQSDKALLCKRPTQVDYSVPAEGYDVDLKDGTESVSKNFRSAKPADLNGDGLMDLTYVENNQFKYFLSNGTRLYRPTPQTINISAPKDARNSWQILDYNGDGNHDLMYIGTRSNKTQWLVHLGQTAGLNPAYPDGGWDVIPIETGVTADPDLSFLVVDENGDGLADIFAYDEDNPPETGTIDYEVYLMRRAASGDYPYEFPMEGELRSIDMGTPPSGYFPVLKDFESAAPVDINADGQADLIAKFAWCQFNSQCESGGTQGWRWAFFVVGDDGAYQLFDEILIDSYASYVDGLLYPSDFNADGLTDVAFGETGTYNWEFGTNTGTEFDVRPYGIRSQRGTNVFLADYNRDGYPDFFHSQSTTNTLQVTFWNPQTNSFLNSESTIIFNNGGAAEFYTPLDVTGDSKMEVVRTATGDIRYNL